MSKNYKHIARRQLFPRIITYNVDGILLNCYERCWPLRALYIFASVTFRRTTMTQHFCQDAILICFTAATKIYLNIIFEHLQTIVEMKLEKNSKHCNSLWHLNSHASTRLPSIYSLRINTIYLFCFLVQPTLSELKQWPPYCTTSKCTCVTIVPTSHPNTKPPSTWSTINVININTLRGIHQFCFTLSNHTPIKLIHTIWLKSIRDSVVLFYQRLQHPMGWSHTTFAIPTGKC